MKKIYLKSVRDVQKLISRVIHDVRGGRLEPSRANSAIYGANSLLRTFQMGDFEQRLSDLEKLIEQRSINGGQYEEAQS